MQHSPQQHRTCIMGILNVTPDSFSDGGRFTEALSAEEAAERRATAFPHAHPAQDLHAVDVADAAREALRMTAEGADIIDVGGESTRPGAEPVRPGEEQRRVVPVVEELMLRRGLAVSLDTRHAQTAQVVLDMLGQRAPDLLINDVSGLLTDPAMPDVIARAGCDVVIMHNRGDSRTMQSKTHYDDVVEDVISELLQIRRWYLDAGVPAEKIILDPGIGFAKTHGQNWELIRSLRRFTALEHRGTPHRVLFGASRKGFLGTLLAEQNLPAGAAGPAGEEGAGSPRPADQRDTATAALSAHAAQQGVWAVRVHAVRPNADAAAVGDRIRAGFSPFSP